MSSRDETIVKYRELCLAKGTYLAALSEELTWFSVKATKSSYLIRASDAPSTTASLDPDDRPAPVELAMICKVRSSRPLLA